MIKFKKKQHIYENKEKGRIVIYYNISDIFLGVALMVLVVFFIHDYLSHALGEADKAATVYMGGAYGIKSHANPPLSNQKN